MPDCQDILSGYTKSCRDAQGGVRKFWITEKANISAYTEASGVLTGITMASGKVFWEYEQELNSASYNEDPQTNRQNGALFYAITFNAVLLKRSAALSYQIRALAVQDVVIITLEQTGTMFISGLANGLALDPSTSPTGTASADRNGYELVFKGEEPMSAPTITQAQLDDII